MSPTSFMSEHTAEYAPVPNLVAQFEDFFPSIVPVYFWATREGSRMGYESINKHTVRVIAAFAMRPKVVDPGDKKITVKINDTLFAAAQVGGEFGIPVLAGVPLVNSLTLFSVGVPCDWFLISESSQATVDCEFMLTLSKQPPRPTLPQNVKGPLTQMELVDIAQSCCHEQDWMRAEVGIRLVKNAGGLHNPIFGGGYRPFFLLMISNQGKIPKNISAH